MHTRTQNRGAAWFIHSLLCARAPQKQFNKTKRAQLIKRFAFLSSRPICVGKPNKCERLRLRTARDEMLRYDAAACACECVSPEVFGSYFNRIINPSLFLSRRMLKHSHHVRVRRAPQKCECVPHTMVISEAGGSTLIKNCTILIMRISTRSQSVSVTSLIVYRKAMRYI